LQNNFKPIIYRKQHANAVVNNFKRQRLHKQAKKGNSRDIKSP